MFRHEENSTVITMTNIDRYLRHHEDISRHDEDEMTETVVTVTIQPPSP